MRNRIGACCNGLRLQSFLMQLAGHFSHKHRGNISFQIKGDHGKPITLVFEQRNILQIRLVDLNRPDGAVNLLLV